MTHNPRNTPTGTKRIAPDGWLSVKGLAKHFGVSDAHIYNRMKKGLLQEFGDRFHLPHTNGKAWYFNPQYENEIRQVLERRNSPPLKPDVVLEEYRFLSQILGHTGAIHRLADAYRVQSKRIAMILFSQDVPIVWNLDERGEISTKKSARMGWAA